MTDARTWRRTRPRTRLPTRRPVWAACPCPSPGLSLNKRVCTATRTHAHTRTQAHTYMHSHIHTHTHAHSRAHIHASHTLMRAHAQMHTHTRTRTCTDARTHAHIHAHSHAHAHTHTHAEMHVRTHAHSSRPRGGCTWPACPRRQSPPRAPWPGRLLTLCAPCPWPKTWGSTRPRRSRQVRRAEGPVGSAVSGRRVHCGRAGGCTSPQRGSGAGELCSLSARPCDTQQSRPGAWGQGRPPRSPRAAGSRGRVPWPPGQACFSMGLSIFLA